MNQNRMLFPLFSIAAVLFLVALFRQLGCGTSEVLQKKLVTHLYGNLLVITHKAVLKLTFAFQQWFAERPPRTSLFRANRSQIWHGQSYRPQLPVDVRKIPLASPKPAGEDAGNRTGM